MEDNVRKKCVCVCARNWVTLLYSRKLTEHCKLTIMENIIFLKIKIGVLIVAQQK